MPEHPANDPELDAAASTSSVAPDYTPRQVAGGVGWLALFMAGFIAARNLVYFVGMGLGVASGLDASPEASAATETIVAALLALMLTGIAALCGFVWKRWVLAAFGVLAAIVCLPMVAAAFGTA